MIGLALVAAVAASIGAVAAVTARDGRLVALGLIVAMIAAPLASSPEPPVLAIAFRILGALLAGYLIWAATRAQSIESEGSGIGALAEVAAAAAGFAIGWFVTPVKPLAGPIATQAAGVSLVVLAIVPLVGRNVMRVGAGVALVTLGISLLLQAWVGPASSLQQVVLMALLVGIVGATSLLVSPLHLPAARRIGAAAAVDRGGPVGPSEEPTAPPAEAQAPTAPEAAPEVAPAVASPRKSTVKAPTGRSPRAIPRGAPSKSSDETAPDDETASGPPAPSPALTPLSTRARRLRPREPRR